jgi:hypothetical protein
MELERLILVISLLQITPLEQLLIGFVLEELSGAILSSLEKQKIMGIHPIGLTRQAVLVFFQVFENSLVSSDFRDHQNSFWTRRTPFCSV